jgi:threonine/homoserine/homoserine lactone efflux protein
MLGSLAAFLVVSAVVIVTPGQDTMLTVRNTLAGGRRCGFFTALGIVCGQVVWTLAASAGITALLLASRPAFVAIRLAGAVVLVALGAGSLRRALRGDRADTSVARGDVPPAATWSGFRQGALSNLGNPKMAAFFTSLLPQFAPHDGSPFRTFLSLGVLFGCMTLVWLSLYAVVIARASHRLRRPRDRRIIEGVSGALLVAFGLRLATEHR